ncbi:sugar ABC transporter ATP-binding protein [Solicola gregarius]|uniref:Sugar ABC transporter ATP-binding protein n=1 Tax=Solicola gregarius TaxID=2908642 RepID=A0AA46TJC6_9ACTN|nr:sugar ABC transporter ATP-binding protein [Solicola gregarius]UYM05912.1 sugar ABC transporter ATP-binding protein [Solicola gregarius]
MPTRADPVALLSMSDIQKSFGGVHALRGASLCVSAGEVHALLGENGAGKSTLMNILSGVIQPDAGTIEIDGRPASFHSPAASQAAGVAMIHQELDLVPHLTVAQNLFLGREPRTPLRTLDVKGLGRKARGLLDEVGIDIAPGRRLGSLRVAEQQMVAIAKALSLDARILVMDEPTSALPDNDVDRLFELLPRLREHGVGIVFISHRMEEIARIADNGTVMRDGRDVGSFEVAQTDPAKVIQLMVGQPIEQLFPDPRQPHDDVRLEVRDLTVPAGAAGRTEPRGIDLSVRRGEILGLAGLLGAGRTELLEALFGCGPHGTTGSVSIDGRRVRAGSPRAAIRAGIGLVPEDRRADGLVTEESVGANILLTALGDLATMGIRRRSAETRSVDESVASLHIKTTNAAVRVGTLSGGNQQKVVFARQLLSGPKVLLLDEPTRGVDIGAKAEIYRLLTGLAADGVTVVVASSELPELLGICHRIAVLRRGRIVELLDAVDATSESVLAAASLEPAAEPQPEAS